MFKLIHTAKEFGKNEDGVATVWALSWLVLCFAIAGLSIDVTNAWKVKQILQSTADVAAHAGAVELQGISTDVDAVVAAANAFARANMNTSRYGDALLDADIEVGTWNHEAKVFTPVSAGGAPDAVRVVTRQDGTGGASNTVGTYFLRFVWRDDFSVTAVAVVQRFLSECGGKDGIFSFTDNDTSANNIVGSEVCFYGRNALNFSQQVTFEDGAVAMSPSLDNCGPGADTCTDAHNPGIEDALTVGYVSDGKIQRIDEYILGLQDPTSEYQPYYINSNMGIIEMPADEFDTTKLKAGRVHVISCTPGENLNLGVPVVKGGGKPVKPDEPPEPIVLSDFVLVGLGCDFIFDPSIHYENAFFATSADGQQTISGSSGVVLGRDDGCAQGGEVAIVTAGSVNFASKLEAYDVEFVIKDDLNLASHAGGDSIHMGSNFFVGGNVRITTDHEFQACVDTVGVLDPQYSFRLVY